MSGALLTIITGTPGAGKTALAVSEILRFLEKQPDRPVYCSGITDLALPHERVPPVEDWTVSRPHPDDPSINYPEFTFPDGALVVLDEAQNFFRTRSAGSRVPDHVAAMERHRHKGLDFILISQGPGLLDPNIRRLCGKHIHLRQSFFGRHLYEWSEIANPENVSERERASKTRYRLPKKVFSLYTSATTHVKNTRRVHWSFYAMGALLVVGAVMTYRMYNRWLVPPEPVVPAVSVSPEVQGVPRPSQASSPVAAPTGSDVQHYVPRIPQRPETAPLYDALRVVKAMPVVAGCLLMADRCVCYTHQATNAFLSDAQCRAWLEEPPFDPYRDPVQLAVDSRPGANEPRASAP